MESKKKVAYMFVKEPVTPPYEFYLADENGKQFEIEHQNSTNALELGRWAVRNGYELDLSKAEDQLP